MTKAIVLSIAGHDPSGGAGIQADIEAIKATGAHATTAITCLTIQDTQNVKSIHPVDSNILYKQIETLLADMPVSVIKLGLLGDLSIINTVQTILSVHPYIPVICDPVLAAGGGLNLSNEMLVAAIQKQILPHVTLLTPNIPEAQALSGKNNLDNCAKELLRMGCENILITGTHSDTLAVTNTLYHNNQKLEWTCERLSHEYHGSGCTLASSIAGYMSMGKALPHAIEMGLFATEQSLKNANALGTGQWIPER